MVQKITVTCRRLTPEACKRLKRTIKDKGYDFLKSYNFNYGPTPCPFKKQKECDEKPWNYKL